MNQGNLYIVAAIVFAMVLYIVKTRREGLDAPARTMAEVDKDLAYMKSVGFKDDGSSDNPTMQRLLAEKKTLGAASVIVGTPSGLTSGLETVSSTLRSAVTGVVDSLSASCSKPPATPGKDWSGATDIARVTSNSAEECATACCGNKDCTKYTYNGANKNCFLKKGGGTMVASIAQAFAGTIVQNSAIGTLGNKAQGLADSTVANVWSTLGDATSITSIALITAGAITVGIMVIYFLYTSFFGPSRPALGTSIPSIGAPAKLL